MSTLNKRFSYIKTQWSNDGILYKSYLYILRRSNKNNTEKRVCTIHSCSCSITTKDDAIIGASGIDNHEVHYPQDEARLPPNVYDCIGAINRQIVEEQTTLVAQVYNEQVKKFRSEHGSADTIPIFGTIKSSLYTTRAMIHPKLPKSLSLIIPPHMTRTSLDETFLFCNNPASYSALGFSFSITTINLRFKK
ncbi:unnamed protein product [Didymodactylos carnosus]|uniref:Uncharacterized protein n=1 Tax=Didymodactylos carnosus TaxID=1234261 RepID=A0A815ACF6_9BILA|nr:unnamed protein product [Didymodactylos carnosus]CAF1254962.1 unnamed protein product [Didymodactylos carnosus]CAF3629392.1 unnamed protein product [Didymodactylos carnosus]CAF4026725.1 unnamed protein product [Didymodactylos carnosus]